MPRYASKSSLRWVGSFTQRWSRRAALLDGGGKRCYRHAIQNELDRLEQLEATVDSSTYANLLQQCSDTNSLENGKRIHEQIVRKGKIGERFMQNLLVQMYGKCGGLQDARAVFDSIAEKNVFSWNIMIGAYVQNGQDAEAMELYKQMTAIPSAVTFITVLNACSNLGSLAEAKAIHGRILKLNLESNPIVGTALVNTFSKCGSLRDAEAVFERMPFKDAVSWTSMITAYAQNGHGKAALGTFRRMNLDGISPDAVTLVGALDACSIMNSFQDGQRIHQIIIRRTAFGYDDWVGAALVNMYAKCGHLVEAWKVFDKMDKSDVLVWNTMLAAYAQNGYSRKAIILYREGMCRESGLKPDAVTYITLLDACTSLRDLDEGESVHRAIVADGFGDDTTVVNALVNMYGKSGKLEHAREVFDSMSSNKKSVVSWNGLIQLYVQHELGKQALELYRRMDTKPDELTFVSVLAACGVLGDLAEGKRLHQHIIEDGFEMIPIVANSLLNMYSKCGSVEAATQVFDKMPERDVISWNAMISAYAEHGQFDEALKLLPCMDLDGARPNHVTFISIFSACSHSGLLDEAWDYFICMTEECKIEPTEKHYGCIVDLLGRAGKLQEAEKFIQNMPIQPGAIVWMTLLSACKLHGDVERGERVAEHAIQLDPKDAALYVALSNIYSAAGRSDDAAKVRKRMEDQGWSSTEATCSIVCADDAERSDSAAFEGDCKQVMRVSAGGT